MAEAGTIRATFRVDSGRARRDLDDIKQHARSSSGELSKLFALEPLGVRRGQHAIESLVRGMTDFGDSARSGIQVATQFGRALSVGFAGGAILGAVSGLTERMVEANEAAVKLDTNIADLTRRGMGTAAFKPMESIQSDITATSAQIEDLQNRLRGMGVGVGGRNLFSRATMTMGNIVQAGLQGKTPQGLEKEYSEDIVRLRKTISDEIDSEALKSREVADIEEKRFRLGERTAALAAEEVRHKEMQGKLSEQARLKGVENLSAMHEENRISEERNRRIEEQQDALQKLADIGLKAETSLSKRAEAAQVTLAEARGDPLARARAAGGVADVGVDQFEAGAREYNMTPSQKAAQYAQRFAQYQAYQRYADRVGIGRGMIARPQYGAAEYEPLMNLRALYAERARQGPAADMTLREQLKAGMFNVGQPIATPIDYTNFDFSGVNAAMRGEKLTPYSQPVNTQPQAVAQPLPSPPAQEGGIADKIASAIAQVFREFWGN